MIDTLIPRKRKRDLCVQQVGGETLVYDEIRHQAFCLNRTSSAVWMLCDGTRTITAVAKAVSIELKAPVSEELVQYAVAELLRDGLLEPESVANLPPDVSRRELMRTLGAGAIAMLPVVAAIMTPTAAQAYTGCADCALSERQKQAILDAQKKSHDLDTDPFNVQR